MTEPPLPEETIFGRAREIASDAERAAFLDRACGGDPTLRAEVESLLRADGRVGDLLDLPEDPAAGLDPPADRTAAAATATAPVPVGDPAGTLVAGRYRLLEPIGEGGMGSVWMAEQREPVKRLVALKLIKPGMDSREVLARFEAERQALALMDHPHIARVLDGGTTGDGRPFFVMDLVKGVPITRYCDEHYLTPRQRLELFIPVCQAVQHAHQKGIIHRDLKPFNVLVAPYDGQPVPKVIDFGVAKATGPPLTEKTLVTGFGAIVGTLEYMSPEQAEINQLDVDTRSDIYSLGVLLYELLTGSPPFSRRELTQAGMLEMLRVIREQEPTKPSTKLSTADGLPTLAANRGTEPARLARLVRGELDWIAMKALEKDRDRRYETANGLAMDVRRYLDDEPVLAGPPSAGYRLRKIARRHWRLLAAGLAFLLLLGTGVVALTIALVAVDRERQQKVAALEAEGERRVQARAALDAMSSGLIQDWLARQTALSPQHKQFLERALRAYEEFAADTGQDEASRAGVAQAFERVGYIRNLLGQRKGAEAAWERGRDLYAGLAADFPAVPAHREGLARISIDLGNLYSQTGRGREAETILGQSLTIDRGLAADFPDVPKYRRELASALTEFGILLKNQGRKDAAISVYGQAMLIHQQLAAAYPAEPDYRRDLAQTHMNLGILLDIARRSSEAEEAHKQAAAIYQQLAVDYPAVPHYRHQLAITRNNLGHVFLQDASRRPEAEETFRRALTIRRQLAADFPAVPEYRRGLAITLSNLGIVLKDTGRAREAEEHYRQALAIHQQLAADFPTVSNHRNEAAGAMVNLARVLLARKELDAARRLLEDALPHHQAALKASPGHPAYRRFYRNNRWRLAETLLELKDHAAAATAAREFLEAAVEPPRDAYTAACLLAGCVRSVMQDGRLDEIKRRELATTYGDSALAALREAIEKGAEEVTQMREDPDLDPLRSRQDFQELLVESEAPRKP